MPTSLLLFPTLLFVLFCNFATAVIAVTQESSATLSTFTTSTAAFSSLAFHNVQQSIIRHRFSGRIGTDSMITSLRQQQQQRERSILNISPTMAVGDKVINKVKKSFHNCHQNYPVRKEHALFASSRSEEQIPAAEPDWYGAPRARSPDLAREFREKVRLGIFTGPTNGVCPGFLQCNMVVLRNGQEAFDFMLFCQRNKKACPLIEVCDVGSACPTGIAPGADLRTDIPRYCVYRDGVLEKEVTDVTEIWPEDSVAFLIGCSFSFDGALIEGGIPLRSVEQNKCVPMYNTNLKCRPSGSLKGNMVVSMKPVKAMDVSKAVEITAKYPHAHGSPVCVGCPEAIGINDVTKPDYGDPVDIKPDEVPVFHACGVTPQNIITESKVPFAITHSPGHMFVADLPSDSTF